jgi:3-oxoacyl-[acyl-carrier-protein] synthase II
LSGLDGSEPVNCPFDARRNGIILSEGAGFLVLEGEDHALGRGASVMAEVMGYGNAFDPSVGEFKQAGKGLKNAITLALKEASLNREDIDYICPSANSSKALDRMETEVVKEIFGDHAFQTPVSSIKSMVGESFSASGVLSLSAAICALEKGFIPPTINFREKDPACDLDYVPNEPRQKKIRAALVISTDPYGNNTAIVLGRYKGDR